MLCTAAPHLDAVADLIFEGKYGILFMLKSSGYVALITMVHLVAITTKERYYSDLYTTLLKQLEAESVPSANRYFIKGIV